MDAVVSIFQHGLRLIHEQLFKILIRLCSGLRTFSDPQNALEVISEYHKDILGSIRYSGS